MIYTLFPWLLLATGALGVALGLNRALKSRANESRVLQVIAFLSGAILLAAPVGMVLQSGTGPAVSGVSILLALLLGICLIGRALKNIPFAFITVAVAATGLFWLLSVVKDFSFAGSVPTQGIALAIAVVLIIVFGISFFVEKAIDLFLAILSMGPVVFIVAAAALIQGLLVGLHITDRHGLLNLLGG
ncbi:MAG TPA: hypothetical protein VN300_11150 [Desulfobacterales bacterium]|nr:hypothetical protein [Desulfobacterales bacterium]